jgi:23S rRNA-/tRNA-specific pseudouridylate synthase
LTVLAPAEDTPRVLQRQGPLWVVYKPAGWLVHTAGSEEAGAPDTLAWLLGAARAPRGIAPLHRIDSDTSGVVLYSESAEQRAAVGRAFANSEVHKQYLACVEGHPHSTGVIRQPLPDARRGKPLAALTRYRRLAASGGVSALSVMPETGRKHQIRRHLAGIGHPLLGDSRYGARARVGQALDEGPWLHALRIEVPGLEAYTAPLPAGRMAWLAEVFGEDSARAIVEQALRLPLSVVRFQVIRSVRPSSRRGEELQ